MDQGKQGFIAARSQQLDSQGFMSNKVDFSLKLLLN